MYYGLTGLGVIHTAISLIAVTAAIVAFIRDRRIIAGNALGKLYIIATVLTCLTGFGIFQHGGFGKPHVLGLITLLVLAACAAAHKHQLFGRFSPYAETIGYTATFLFHMIPAITETSTRLPYGAPLLPNAEAPELKTATAILFGLFLLAAFLQARSLKYRLAQGTPQQSATP